MGMAMVTEDRLRRGMIHMLPVSFNLSIACLDSVSSRVSSIKKRRCGNVADERKAGNKNIRHGAGSGPIVRRQPAKGDNRQMVVDRPEILILDEPQGV